MIKLSIIVPVYKVKPYLHDCVDSILAQTFRDFELILVNDYSPDDCGTICDQYAKQDSRIRVIHRKSNGGLSAARNTGIDVAKGEFIAFVDSDDHIGKYFFQRAISLLEPYKEGEIDIAELPVEVHYNIPAGYRYGNLQKNEIVSPYPQSWTTWVAQNGLAHTYAWNKVYRRYLFNNLRFPEGHLFEDIYTIPRLMKKSKGVIFCGDTTPDERYFYRQRQHSITVTTAYRGLYDALHHHLWIIDEIYSQPYKEIPQSHLDRYLLQVTNLLIDLLRHSTSSDKELQHTELIGNIYNRLQAHKPNIRRIFAATPHWRTRLKNLPFALFGLKIHCFCYSKRWIKTS